MTLDQGGRAAADTQISAPPPELAAWIEHVFVRRDELAPHAGSPWRIVPDPCAHLIVVVRATPAGDVLRGALVGARSTFTDIDVSGRRLTLGVRLRPGALPVIARTAAAELTDRAVPADDVFGAAWRRGVDRFTERDPLAVLGPMFAALRARLRTAVADRAWTDAVTDPMIDAVHTARSVDRLADAVGMAPRTVHQRSVDRIGLSPKRLLRILRLYRALHARRSALGWAEVAAVAGFADQPHLVRELRDLLGEPPGAWFARGNARCRSVQDRAEPLAYALAGRDLLFDDQMATIRRALLADAADRRSPAWQPITARRWSSRRRCTARTGGRRTTAPTGPGSPERSSASAPCRPRSPIGSPGSTARHGSPPHGRMSCPSPAGKARTAPSIPSSTS